MPKMSETGRSLSVVESECIALLANGRDVPAIARELELPPHIVERQLDSARDALGAKSRLHAVILAIAMRDLGG
ncbi:LuxR C-terminal-related transcriptional regulator [Pararhizobium haloflavum]|uniref:LuxR C-terminal-related transcriptional regulator n=1 Tax=Pararhizobium haloflavum TaxID=2037914 RepID=UPI000C18A4B4|nr:LuxR C-terminal-related transcriptional regulator [Pararhizobium haloflavum]